MKEKRSHIGSIRIQGKSNDCEYNFLGYLPDFVNIRLKKMND